MFEEVKWLFKRARARAIMFFSSFVWQQKKQKCLANKIRLKTLAKCGTKLIAHALLFFIGVRESSISPAAQTEFCLVRTICFGLAAPNLRCGK
jgi:hypothetical protein